jgi:hypothetical protein
MSIGMLPVNGRRRPPPGFDDQLWPINCAILVLAGFVAGIILAQRDLDDPRLLYNKLIQLGVVAAMVVVAMIGAYALQGKIRRRLQLCVLISLLIHLSGAVFVYCHPVILDIVTQTGGGSLSVPVDEELVAPDYHWVQAEEPDLEQAFDTPLATAAQEEAPPAAAIQPPERAPTGGWSRDVPVSEVPRSVAAEESPLAPFTAATVAMPVAPVVASRGVEPLAGLALAMNRQALRPVEMPEAKAEAPAVPAAPKQAVVEPQAPAAEKMEPQAPPALAAAAPLGGASQSRAVARLTSEPGQALPAGMLVAMLPGAGAARPGAARGGGRETEVSGQSSTLVRADVGRQALPSSVLPNEGDVSLTPAAAGGSAGSRLDVTSAVAVERTPRNRAPLGPTAAAAGTQDLGVGSGLVLARAGVPGGRGTGRPSVAGLWGEEEDALQAGAPGSLSDRGAPLAVAAARRARAAQPGGGGTSAAPGLSATLPRTQRPTGSDLPSAVLPSEGPAIAGGGGVSAGLGGGTSRLAPGTFGSVARAGATGTGQSQAAGPAGGAGYPGALDFGAGSSALVGGGVHGLALPTAGRPNGAGYPGNARRSGTTEPALAGGVARAAGTARLPGGAEEVASAPSTVLPAKIVQNSQTPDTTPGRGLTEVAMATTGPADVLVIGRGAGRPAVGGEDAGGTDAGAGSRLLGPAGATARRSRSDVDADALAAVHAPVALVRGNEPFSLEGTVKEPTPFYRHRGSLHHGLGPNDIEGAGFTEPTVEFGLGFFTRLQFPDGHWSLDRLPEGLRADDPALSEMQADTAATGLVLLAYLGAGYTHLDEKYRDVVRRGLEWLVKHQKPDGDLFTGGSKFAHFYGHGMAAMALCEVYGMTQDPELREPARKAVEFIVSTQDPRRGGWRYDDPRQGGRPNDYTQYSDTSVTGWQLMALKSAQMAGLDVPQTTLDRIRGWLDQAEGPGRDGHYAYNPWGDDAEGKRDFRAPSLAMTAEAMLMRMYLGQRRTDGRLMRGAEYLAANLPEVGTRQNSTRDCYYWYYATQAMYEMQGSFWPAWQGRLNPLLKAGQVQEGPLAGSWHPLQPVPDRWFSGGRIYVTAMNLLMLEVCYRHLPLFQELSK